MVTTRSTTRLNGGWLLPTGRQGSQRVGTGHTVLVHAAAGGVGSLLCQWANTLGSTAIGIVSNEEKAALVHIDGCHHVIMYTKEVVATTVKEITDEKGVNVVYDSVGKHTYMKLRWLILEAKLVQFLTTPGLICFLLYPRLNWSK